MGLLKVKYLLSDAESELIHTIVPLNCKFLEFFFIKEIDLTCFLLVLIGQTILDTLLGMLSDHLDVLELCIGIHILTLIGQVNPLSIELVDQVSNVVDELFLLDDRRRLAEVALLVNSLFSFIISHIVGRHVLFVGLGHIRHVYVCWVGIIGNRVVFWVLIIVGWMLNSGHRLN